MAGARPRSSMGVILAVLACLPAGAEPPDALRLPETVIEAEDQSWRAQSPSVTETDEVQSEGSLTLDETLTTVPGVYAQNENNFAQGLRISIRGFGSRASFGVRGIQVRLDEVPLTLPDGQTELDVLDLDLLESIAVSRGAAGAQYGNSAGGVIAIQSRIPMPEPYVSASFSGGSHGLRQGRMEAGGNVLGADMLGAFRRVEVDGYRDHARFDSDLFNYRGSLSTGFGEFGLDLTALEIESDDPGALTRTQVRQDRRQAAPRNLQFDGGEEISQQRVALRWQTETATLERVHAVLFAGQRDFDNRLPFNGGGQVSFERASGGLGAGLTWVPDFMGATHEIDAGLDVQIQRDDRSRFNNNNGQRGALTLRQDEQADSIGVYLQDAWTLTPDWVLTAALRHDDLELKVDDAFLADGDDSGGRDFSNTTWSAGLSRRLYRDHQLQARVASGFESPTFTELANPAGGGFNPNLEPAETRAYELGVSGQAGVVTYELVAYRINIDDELIPFELAGQPGRTFFRNAGTSRRDGLEGALSVPVTEQLRLGAVATLSDYRFRDYVRGGMDFSGNRLPGVPERHGAITLDYEHGPLRAGAVVDLVGKLFADDANAEQVSGYGLLHMNAEYELRIGDWQITPYAGVRNLLDKEYFDNVRINAFGGRSFEPAAERSWYAGLRAVSF